MSVKDYLFYKASINKIPLSGTFELSPVCNFECKMCYVRKKQKDLKDEGRKLHSANEWLELAEKCKDAGMLYLLLTGGEPFLYPEFKYLYEKLHEMGFIISINTNASMIDEKTVEWLKKYAPARLNITLYGASEETYEKICGKALAYPKVKKAILMLKDAGISMIINASMIPENANDMQEIIRFGKENKIIVRVGTYMFPPIRRKKENTDSRLTAKQAGYMNVIKQFYGLDQKIFVQEGKNALQTLQKMEKEMNGWGHDEGEQMQCRAGKSTFWISWEGKMTACGIMDFPVVKYPFQEDFIDCWNDLTQQVRTKTVLKECKQCSKKGICRPCVAIIHAETGDVNKKASYLCEMTDMTIECWKTMIEKMEKADAIL